MPGKVTIEQDGAATITRDMDKVLVLGVDADTSRELIGMQEAERVLRALTPAEAGRVAAWLYAKFTNG